MADRRFPPRLGYPVSHREPKETNTRVHPSELVGEYPNITGLGVLTHLEVSGQVEFTGTDEFLVTNDYVLFEPESGFDVLSHDYIFLSAERGIDLIDVGTFGITLQAEADIGLFAGTDGTGTLNLSANGGTSTIEMADIIEVSPALAVGAGAAQSGVIRIPYGDSIKARNAGDTADISVFGLATAGAPLPPSPTTNNIYVGGVGAGNMHFLVDNGTKWLIYGASGYHLIPWDNYNGSGGNSNRQDIGSDMQTLRSVYVGTHIAIGTSNVASAGALRFSNGQVLNWRNGANTQDIGGMLVDSANKVNIGGNAAGIVIGASLEPFGTTIDVGGTGSARFRRGYFINVSAGGIDYTWPSSQAANRVLKTNGTSTLSWAQVDLTTDITGIIPSGNVAGSYTGITGVGTLVAGAVPASLVTAGPFGAGNYVFPGELTVTSLLRASAAIILSGLRNVVSDVNTDLISLAGGTGAAVGGNIRLFGSTHATQANDIEFRSGSTVKLTWDASAATWLLSAPLSTSAQLTSTVSTGTTPLVIASTTLVSNLTVENLGAAGQNAAFFRSSSNQNAGTLPTGRLTGSYTGITGVGTLSSALTISLSGVGGSGLIIDGPAASNDPFLMFQAGGVNQFGMRVNGAGSFDIGHGLFTVDLRLSPAGVFSFTNPPLAPGMVLGTDPTGAQALRVGGLTHLLSTTANQLRLAYSTSQYWDFDVSSAGNLTLSPVSSGTLNFAGTTNVTGGALTVGTNATTRQLKVNGPAGTYRDLIFETAGSARWGVRCETTAESGSNAGSDLIVEARQDDSSPLDIPIRIPRPSTSAIALARDVNLASGKVYKVNGTQVLTARNTGWTAPTATQSKAGFGNGATTTQLEQNLSAVINALITHGILGA